MKWTVDCDDIAVRHHVSCTLMIHKIKLFLLPWGDDGDRSSEACSQMDACDAAQPSQCGLLQPPQQSSPRHRRLSAHSQQCSSPLRQPAGKKECSSGRDRIIMTTCSATLILL